ncbi:hypothetical protein DFO66_102119 [Brevibacterium sanguinis]|uniref:Heavy-metal-associated domain-containing protein n=2 Tax=Brevibacterium TaxID=1696 RepID=A0A366ILJ0_9MICO|nr:MULTISPECIES: heavy-metal-associated domain-containing protein [Brevibacterium]RBP67066.1 hypothetical protein DFO66_102119 [Brevibacterium sanguinis]RBP73591.1 hypothetical protein DFO65_102119 [Brevibacterium celere]
MQASTIGRLIGALAVLALVLVAAFGLGRALGPVGPTAADPAAGDQPMGEGDESAEAGGHGAATDAGHDSATEDPGAADEATFSAGLSLDSGGYRLGELSAPTKPEDRGEIAFTVLDENDRAVTDFDVSHEQELHLIVVRADGSHFHHVHPERDESGRWTLPWSWDAAGTYRIYADIVPSATGEPLTLSSTVQVAGDYRPESVGDTVTSVEVDGFEVSLDGELTAGESSPVTIAVRRDGKPVTDLEPHMGAFGHLTGLRHGDLAYLHVHPHGKEPGPGDTGGPSIDFEITAPTDGRYLLYLDFKVDGQVHTAGFVVDAGTAHIDDPAESADGAATGDGEQPGGDRNAPADADGHEHEGDAHGHGE